MASLLGYRRASSSHLMAERSVLGLDLHYVGWHLNAFGFC
jgi:hypothetical protein